MLKPVYALIGADPFLQLQALRQVLRQAPPDIQRIEFDGEEAELAAVLDELRSFSMFASSKLVVVRNADAFVTRYREQLENFLQSPPPGATLVLRLDSLPSSQRIYKVIAKSGQAQPCLPLKEKELLPWISERARTEHKLVLSAEAARLLAELVGNDLGRLDSELAKLALRAEGGRVTPQLISASVAFQREQEMWDMTDELAAGRAAEAIRRWRLLVQLDASAEYRAVTWLAMWLEKVRRALAMQKEGQSAFDICQALKVWPRERHAPFMAMVQAVGERGAARLIDLLARIDYESKTGVGAMADNVERFMLSVAADAPAR